MLVSVSSSASSSSSFLLLLLLFLLSLSLSHTHTHIHNTSTHTQHILVALLLGVAKTSFLKLQSFLYQFFSSKASEFQLQLDWTELFLRLLYLFFFRFFCKNFSVPGCGSSSSSSCCCCCLLVIVAMVMADLEEWMLRNSQSSWLQKSL
jgi:hypothetical protein